MKIIKIDTEDFIVFVEENGVVFSIYYAHQRVLNFIEDLIQKHQKIIASGIDFWVVKDPRDPFVLGYDAVMRKYPNDSLDELKRRIKEEYDSFVSFGIIPEKDTFKIPSLSKKSIIEKYYIPEEAQDKDFYVFRLTNEVRNYIASHNEKRDSEGRYDNHRRNL